MSLKGTKQSVGLMQLRLNTSAPKLTDCFVARNDKGRNSKLQIQTPVNHHPIHFPHK